MRVIEEGFGRNTANVETGTPQGGIFLHAYCLKCKLVVPLGNCQNNTHMRGKDDGLKFQSSIDSILDCTKTIKLYMYLVVVYLFLYLMIILNIDFQCVLTKLSTLEAGGMQSYRA